MREADEYFASFSCDLVTSILIVMVFPFVPSPTLPLRLYGHSPPTHLVRPGSNPFPPRSSKNGTGPHAPDDGSLYAPVYRQERHVLCRHLHFPGR